MKRIDDMFPDSIQPKFQIALQSLNYSVMNPHAPQNRKSSKRDRRNYCQDGEYKAC